MQNYRLNVAPYVAIALGALSTILGVVQVFAMDNGGGWVAVAFGVIIISVVLVFMRILARKRASGQLPP